MISTIREIENDDTYRDGLLITVREGYQEVEMFYPKGSEKCLINCFTYMPNGERLLYCGVTINTHENLIEEAENLAIRYFEEK